MDVRVTGAAASGTIAAAIDPSSLAMRVTNRGIEHSPGTVVGGQYRIGGQTGTMAAGIASAAEVFQVRWADPSKYFILTSLVVQCATLTGFAALSLGAPLELMVGHGTTANGSGGAALAPVSTSNKMRSTMATTAFATSGRIGIATTAALTAATGQSLEAASIGECMGAANGTLVQTSQLFLFDQRDTGDHPLVLNAGDSLVVRTLNPAATGTWVACFQMEWVEATAY